MTGVLQINETPSGWQQEVPGKHVGQPHSGSSYQHGWWRIRGLRPVALNSSIVESRSFPTVDNATR
jgi:hypothetical protein